MTLRPKQPRQSVLSPVMPDTIYNKHGGIANVLDGIDTGYWGARTTKRQDFPNNVSLLRHSYLCMC